MPSKQLSRAAKGKLPFSCVRAKMMTTYETSGDDNDYDDDDDDETYDQSLLYYLLVSLTLCVFFLVILYLSCAYSVRSPISTRCSTCFNLSPTCYFTKCRCSILSLLLSCLFLQNEHCISLLLLTQGATTTSDNNERTE